jgi:penicillin G amidase
MRNFSWFLSGLLHMIIVAVRTGYIYLRRLQLHSDRVIKVAGLHATVKIIRDVDAVPHIYAQHKLDAFFGLGYVHAQDRLWQMDLQRRAGNGRLSEIFGEKTVATDRYLRTLGLHRAAKCAWPSLSEDGQQMINAYITGINSFIVTHTRLVPPEFIILNTRPEPWTELDVLVWIKMMAWNLGCNLAAEELRSDLMQQVSPERVEQLLPLYQDPRMSGSAPRHISGTALEAQSEGSTSDYEQLKQCEEGVRSILGFGGSSNEGIGSNGWVVDGTKTTTGKPMLANDPHLGSGIPGIWYMAHLCADELDVIGATIPGLPTVIVGRNQSIAWGLTNLFADVQDLFREKIDPTGRMAEFQNKMEQMELVTETIKVKGRPDIQQLVRITRHGPLISDAINANEATKPPDRQRPAMEPLALRWTALDPDDMSTEVFLRINQAHTWPEFRQALGALVAPSLNFLYADVAGNIGYQAAGRIPIRAAGRGLHPTEGWTGINEWTGWIPFDELPKVYNPPEHFIVNANNKSVSDIYPYFLGQEWPPPYRADRIIELVEAQIQLDIVDHCRIQTDTVSLYARQLLPLIISQVKPRNAEERWVLDLLEAWDYDTKGDSIAATVFEIWQMRLLRCILGNELDERLLRRYENWFSFTSQFLINTFTESSTHQDIMNIAEATDYRDIVAQAFQEAIRDLKTWLGTNMNTWHWDQLHMAVFPHQPFEYIVPLRRFFSRRVSSGGDGSTVNCGLFVSERPCEQIVLASYRQICDLGNTNRDRFILAPGQSGNPFSPHYDDYLNSWQAGRYRPMRFDQEPVECAKKRFFKSCRDWP